MITGEHWLNFEDKAVFKISVIVLITKAGDLDILLYLIGWEKPYTVHYQTKEQRDEQYDTITTLITTYRT